MRSSRIFLGSAGTPPTGPEERIFNAGFSFGEMGLSASVTAGFDEIFGSSAITMEGISTVSTIITSIQGALDVLLGDMDLSGFANISTPGGGTLQDIFVESFDQDVTTGSFTLSNDFGDLSKAFIRNNNSIIKSSCGPIASTGNTGPHIVGIGSQLSGTDTVDIFRGGSSSNAKLIGEVWRYEGASGGPNEFIVRGQFVLTVSGTSASAAVSGIVNEDNCVVFLQGWTTTESSVNNYETVGMGVRMDGAGNVVASRKSSVATTIVYCTVVEFTGSNWTVATGVSASHDSARQLVTLSQDIVDWDKAWIEATGEGDSAETGLSDLHAVLYPGTGTTTVYCDYQTHGDNNARNDGTAYIYVLYNPDINVYRNLINNTVGEGNNTYGTIAWPAGTPTDKDLDRLALEWFVDTSGTGTAWARGCLGARITDAAGTIQHWVHRSGNDVGAAYAVIDLSGLESTDVTGPQAFASFDKTFDALDISSDSSIGLFADGSFTLEDVDVESLTSILVTADGSFNFDALSLDSLADVESNDISANLSVTLGDLGLTGTAFSFVNANMTVSFDAVILSATASLPTGASLAEVLQELVLASGASSTISGIVDETLADLAVDSSGGAPAVTTDSNFDLDGLQLVADGIVSLAGDTAVSFQDLVVDSTLSASINSSVAIILDDLVVDSLSASDINAVFAEIFEGIGVISGVSTDIDSDLNVTFDNLILSSLVSSIAFSVFDFNQELDPLTVTADSVSDISGDTGITFDPVAVNSETKVFVTASYVGLFDSLSVESEAKAFVIANADLVFDNLEISVQAGSPALLANSAFELDSLIVDSTGSVPAELDFTVVFDDIGVSADAESDISAYFADTFESLDLSSVSETTRSISSTFTLSDMELTGDAGVGIQADAASTFEDLSINSAISNVISGSLGVTLDDLSIVADGIVLEAIIADGNFTFEDVALQSYIFTGVALYIECVKIENTYPEIQVENSQLVITQENSQLAIVVESETLKIVAENTVSELKVENYDNCH